MLGERRRPRTRCAAAKPRDTTEDCGSVVASRAWSRLRRPRRGCVRRSSRCAEAPTREDACAHPRRPRRTAHSQTPPGVRERRRALPPARARVGAAETRELEVVRVDRLRLERPRRATCGGAVGWVARASRGTYKRGWCAAGPAALRAPGPRPRARFLPTCALSRRSFVAASRVESCARRRAGAEARWRRASPLASTNELPSASRDDGDRLPKRDAAMVSVARWLLTTVVFVSQTGCPNVTQRW